MKKFRNFLFAMLCFYLSDLKAQDQQKISQIIKLAKNKLAVFKHITYTVDNLFLTVGDIDTTYNSKITVIKSNDATYIYGNRSKCAVNYIVIMDTISFQYGVNECNKNYDKFIEHSLNKSWYGMFHSGLDRFDSTYIRQYLNTDRVKYQSIQKVVLNKTPCYKIKILQPDMGNIFTDGYMILYITEDDMLLKIEEGVKISGENTYYSFEIKDYSFKETDIKNKETDIKNKINEIEQSYTYTPWKSTEISDSLKNIKHSKIINEIKGKKIGDVDSSIISFKGKVYLLDFWFMGCYGCMLSYPVMDSINIIYKSNPNFNFASFNLRDTDPRLLKRVQNYMNKNHITENIYFAPRDIINNLFGENGFPLFVIIDDTKIKYVQLGYNDELFKNLTKKIDESLLKYKK